MSYGEQRIDNLNLATIDNADGPDVPFPSVRTPTVAIDGKVEVHFDGLESVLVRKIIDAPVVVGCVAWLTNERVLRALSGCEAVSIIVNKEDFLRPDKGSWSQRKIKELYSALRDGCRYEFDTGYSYAGDPTCEAIRCAGIYGDRKSVPPRMHHKFFVFCEYYHRKITYRRDTQDRWWEEESVIEVDSVPNEPETDSRINGGNIEYRTNVRPVCVWTGSFNASENGTRSLENVVVIHDRIVAEAYFSEWKTILGISEPLDWSSQYVCPEWRLGT